MRVADSMKRCFASVDRIAARQEEAGEDAATEPADAKLAVRMLARHSDLSTETSGSPADVLADIDPVGLVSLSIRAGNGQAGHVVTAERMVLFDLPIDVAVAKDPVWFAGITLSRSSGAVLRVNGSDPAWVRSTFNELKTEMRKGVPAWWWLRHGYIWFAYAILASAAVGLAVNPTLGANFWIWGLATLVGGVALGSVLFTVARRLLPGFELVHEGQSGKAAAVIAFTLALVAQIPVGVLVNKWTD